MTHHDMTHDADDEMWRDDGATAPADDLLDARIARLAAAHYHRPPDIAPRDAMWEAIVAQRAARSAAEPAAASTPALTVVAGTTHPAREQRARGAWAHRSAWWLAAAASLVLATGVGLGRWWSALAGDAVTAGGAHEVPGVVVAKGPTRAPSAGTAAEYAPRSGAERAARSVAENSAPAGGAEYGGAPAPRTTRRAPRIGGPRDADVAYQLATLRHLTEVEALLVSYRDDDPEDAAIDARLSGWARRLLDDTRLLMDSPAADNPRRRRLLEDLELVLVQMTQLDTSAPDRERPLIDETLRHSQLMPRLRAAVPAGTTGT